MRRFLVLFLVAAPLVAANREVQNVEVVQVPVYVSTVNGVVTGLTRDNFELFVNGKRQSIDYFDVIDFARVAPQPTAAALPDPRQRRLYVLLFDLYYAEPKSIHRTQQAAQALVAHAGPADVFAVATYSSRRGINVLVPFTKDRAALAQAISVLRPAADADPLRLKLNTAEAQAIERAFDRNDLPPAAQTPNVAMELIADQQRGLVADQMGALGLLAENLAPLEGQKHVVLLSGGFDTTLLHGVEPLTMRRNAPAEVGFVNQRKPQVFAMNGQGLMDLRAMIRKYADAGVFLDAVDTAGLRHTWVVAENESLYALTRDTGGSVVDNRNDLAEALEVLTDRQRVVYVLGFHNRDTGRGENSIRVRLSGVAGNPTVRYRPSYSPMVPKPSPENGLQLADILLNDIPQNGVTVNATANRNTLSVSIPARELLAQIDERHARADAMIYVFSGPRVVATKVKAIDIESERAAKAPRDAAIHFEETFDLPPGQYTAKVLVRLGEAMGFAKAELAVP
ncbi:MAG TPA: VWA domain-containing protein [Thermoanaerobaculia bacterium]|nr:VWA domain-containing protein [Thermoanaerobaculia bacterium]